MKYAASLYKGGNLFDALNCDYSSSRELGLICPFCRGSVFLAKGQRVAPHWRHYRVTVESEYCEKRSLSPEGKEELIALQIPAQKQRLKLFNRRFWEIYKHKKDVPVNLRRRCPRAVGEDTLSRLIKHCHEQWHVEQIIEALPRKLKWRKTQTEAVESALRIHPALEGVTQEIAEELVNDFVKTEISVLRYKILIEVVLWLKTVTARESFEKVLMLALIDSLEVLPPPIHSQAIAEMMVVSLALTDWEEAIASLDNKTKAIGFA